MEFLWLFVGWPFPSFAHSFPYYPFSCYFVISANFWQVIKLFRILLVHKKKLEGVPSLAVPLGHRRYPLKFLVGLLFVMRPVLPSECRLYFHTLVLQGFSSSPVSIGFWWDYFHGIVFLLLLVTLYSLYYYFLNTVSNLIVSIHCWKCIKMVKIFKFFLSRTRIYACSHILLQMFFSYPWSFESVHNQSVILRSGDRFYQKLCSNTRSVVWTSITLEP